MNTCDQGILAARQRTFTRARAKAFVERALYVSSLFALILGLSSAAKIFPWAASLLPGIKPSTPPTVLLLDAILVAVAAAWCAFTAMLSAAPSEPTFKETFTSTWRRFRHALVLLGRVLGIRRYAAGELVRMLLLAAALAAALMLLSHWAISLPFGPGWAPVPDDPRMIAIHDAALPVQVLHSLVTAPVVEEVLFRGPVLLAAFLLATPVSTRDIPPMWRNIILGGTIAVFAVLFAAVHAGANGSNVVTAAVAGLVMTWLALRYKTLLPGIFLHAFFNGLWPLT